MIMSPPTYSGEDKPYNESDIRKHKCLLIEANVSVYSNYLEKIIR